MWYNVFAMENAIPILSSFVNVLNIHVKKSLLAITILSCLLCTCFLCQGCWTLKSFSSQTLLIENGSQKDVKFRACRCEEDWRPLSGVSVTFFNYTWNAEGTGYTKLRVGMAPHASVCLKSHSRAVVHLSKELADLGNEKALWKRPSEQKTNIIPLANCWKE